MNDTFETFRHIRSGQHKPAVTFYFRVDHDAKKVNVGWARCSGKDNFCKKIGRQISKGTVDTRGVSTDYNSNISLVDNAIIALRDTIDHNRVNMKAMEQTNDMEKVLSTVGSLD